MADDRFQKAEDQYYVLLGQLSTGRITRAQFDAAVKSLMIQDAQGRHWTIGADSGKWYMHDGRAWVEASPGGATAPAPMAPPQSLPEQQQRVSAQPQVAAPRAQTSAMVYVLLGGFLLTLALLLTGGILLILNRPTPVAPGVAQSPAASLAPTPGGTGSAQSPAASLAPTPPTPTLRPTASAPTSTSTPALVSSSVTGVKVSIVSAPTPAPIAAKDFAALNAQLAQKIATLNQAELKFIRDMRALSQDGRSAGLAFPPLQKGSLTEQDIKDIAGKAMDVAILAEDLGNLAAKQDKGSNKAAQSADGYFAIARNALSLVVDAQNVRSALNSGLIPGGQAVDTIASYGAQLWNSAVTDGSTKGNPFTAQTKNAEPVLSLNSSAAAQAQSQVNASNSSIWIAKSDTQSTKTINVPAATSPVSNPFDPQVKASLTSTNAQSDGNKAQQVAAANLQVLGAQATSSDPSKPTQLQVPTSPVAVAGSDQLKAGVIPSFKSGKATVVSKEKSSDDNSFMDSLGLNGEEKPTDQGKTTVQDAPALVNLSLSNIVIGSVNKRPKGSGTFEADVQFSFVVNWSTNLAAPRFTLICNSGLTNAVTQASGTLNLNASGLLILYPGTQTVYCYATSTNGQTLGSVSVDILVGDAAEATTRAIQVETDSAILNITLTADAKATESVQQTQTASAQQTLTAVANATANAQKTIDAVSTEVAGTATAEFKLTAAAFATRRAIPTNTPIPPTATPTFTPKVVDQLSHPGNVASVTTNVVLQPGRLYRFSFGGRVNLINPTRSLSASQLGEKVNGIRVPGSGVVVVQGTGARATISCSTGEPDPKNPGGYGITVEDLGPM